MDRPRKPPGAISCPPPPPENPTTAAWSLAWRALRSGEELEGRLWLAFGELEAKVQANADRLREVRRIARRSGHDLDEVKEWKEDSEVRDLRQELARANEIIKARTDARREWVRWVRGLVAALIVVVVTAIVREATRR